MKSLDEVEESVDFPTHLGRAASHLRMVGDILSKHGDKQKVGYWSIGNLIGIVESMANLLDADRERTVLENSYAIKAIAEIENRKDR